MSLSKVTVERISILAEFMDGLDAPRFSMSKVIYPCGAPACALGWAATLPLFSDLREKMIGNGFEAGAYKVLGISSNDWAHLFRTTLSETIKTPQQWAAHARKWLRNNGAEPIVSAKESAQNAAPQGSALPSGIESTEPAVAAPDLFRAFMSEVLRPVDCEEV